MKNIFPIFLILLIVKTSIAQNVTPLQLSMNPDKLTGLFSGFGGASFNSNSKNELSDKYASASLQGSFEINFRNKFFITKSKDSAYAAWPVVVQANLNNVVKSFNKDTFLIQFLSFTGNDNRLLIGISRKWTKLKGPANSIKDNVNIVQIGLAYSNIRYNIPDDSNSILHTFDVNQTRFYFNFNYCDNFDDDNILGISLSPQAIYLNISNQTENAFESITKTNPQQLSFNYIGVGGKGVIQFNSFNLYGECNKFFSLGKSQESLLTKNFKYSIGISITGDFIKLRKKIQN